MSWSIEFEQEFDEEYEAMAAGWQDTLLAHLGALEKFGPQLGRPHVDTLKDSTHPNMKELRFKYDGGVWRVAFAFDPERKGIVLVAGDKRGADQKKFYKQLITTADRRFTNHLNNPPQPEEDHDHDNTKGETQ